MKHLLLNGKFFWDLFIVFICISKLQKYEIYFYLNRYYSTRTDHFRAFLEITYIFLFWYYLYCTLKQWWKLYVVEVKKRNPNQNLRLIDYLGAPPSRNALDQSWAVAVCYFLYLVFRSIVNMILWTVLAIKTYCQLKFTKTVKLATLVSSYLGWLPSFYIC